MRGQNYSFYFESHSIHWAKQKRRFYKSNLKYFYNFPGHSAEKCQALYGINCILVSKVNFNTIAFFQELVLLRRVFLLLI
jgi:hypothetical protein